MYDFDEKIEFQINDGEDDPIMIMLRLPNADEHLEYLDKIAGMSSDEGAVGGAKLIRANRWLVERCLVSATGYKKAGSEMKDVAYLKKNMPISHIMVAADHLARKMQLRDEKIKN